MKPTPNMPSVEAMWRRLTAFLRGPSVTPSTPGRSVTPNNTDGRPDDHRQAERTAEAIKEWDIQRGCRAVAQIELPFLLRRIARAARQDAIRMAAALRLDDAALIRAVALGAKDISLRWQGAQHLNDPLLISEVALFRPTDDRFEELRHQAHLALYAHLDNLQWQGDADRLKAYLFAVQHPPFKVEAFVRLPADAIQPADLRHMAGQDYRYLKDTLLKHLFIKVQSAGWRAVRNHRSEACAYCSGSGQLILGLGTADAGGARPKQAIPCPECRASGRQTFDEVTCSRDPHPPIRFRLFEADT